MYWQGWWFGPVFGSPDAGFLQPHEAMLTATKSDEKRAAIASIKELPNAAVAMPCSPELISSERCACNGTAKLPTTASGKRRSRHDRTI